MKRSWLRLRLYNWPSYKRMGISGTVYNVQHLSNKTKTVCFLPLRLNMPCLLCESPQPNLVHITTGDPSQAESAWPSVN